VERNFARKHGLRMGWERKKEGIEGIGWMMKSLES
jgi:hypothetical protein